VGPWYQINQEKIILMVYHHIRATGQVGFLFEQVRKRTVLEWMKMIIWRSVTGNIVLKKGVFN